MYSREEILKALQVIKGTCEKQEECAKCPLCKNEICVIQDQPPIEWKIQKQDPIWKAFE